MSRHSKFLFVFVLVFISTYGNSQLSSRIQEQLRFKYLTIDEGLNDNRVRGLTQDRYGFIWIGTRFGISRFDGYSVKKYFNFYDDTSAFEMSETKGMFCDSRGLIWSVGQYGICKYNVDLDRFVKFTHDSLKSSINRSGGLDEDSKGNMWFATHRGLLKFNPETNKLELFEPKDDFLPKALPIGHLDKVVVSHQDHVWFGFIRNSVGYYDQEKQEFKHFPSSSSDSTTPAEKKVERLYCDTKGNIWVGHNNNGISKYSYQENTFTRYFPEPGRNESGRVRGIIEDRQGNFWFGTQAGLYLFNELGESFTRYAYAGHPISTLSHNSIQLIMVDNQEGLWLGTIAGGVSYTNLNSSGIIKYEYSNIPSEYYLNDKNVFSLAYDYNDNIWVGTENGGLNFLNRQTGKFTYYRHDPENLNSPLTNNIKCIFVDKEGLVWFGTYKGGMSVLKPETGEFKHYIQTPEYPQGIWDESVFEIVPDNINDDILWVGCTTRWLMFNKRDETFTEMLPDMPGFSNVPSVSRIYSICDAGNNKLVFGADKIIILDRDSNSCKSIDSVGKFNISSVKSVFRDKKGFIWCIANTRLLVRYDLSNDSLLLLTNEDGLPTVDFLQGVADNKGNIWLSSNKGLWKLENIVNAPDMFNLVHYDKSDNIQSLDFLHNSKAVSSTGEILFGGINGFNSFVPENVKSNPYVPNVFVTNMSIAGENVEVGKKVFGKVLLEKPIMETKKLRLHHEVRVFTLHFTGFHFVAPENNQFRYKLENYDEDWEYADVGIRSATYSNLPAGKYVFVVDATNNNGRWSENPYKIKITIRPPFWKTIWFITIVIAAIGFLIYLFVKFRENQLKQDKEELEEKLKIGQEEIEKSREEIGIQKKMLLEKEEQERIHRWFNEGLARFGDLLKEDKNDLQLLAQALVSNIVQYIEVEQGGVFLEVREAEKEPYLELFGHFAMNNERLEKKQFLMGEGQIGACYTNRKVIQNDNLPDNYMSLSSGLGEAKLPYLLLVPIMHDELIVGVLELASFNKVEDFKIDFLKKVNESIVSVVNTTISNNVIQNMLEKSQEQAEQLMSQEEELRQNLEEMLATQEESVRKEKTIQEEAEKYKKLCEELEHKVEELQKNK